MNIGYSPLMHWRGSLWASVTSVAEDHQQTDALERCEEIDWTETARRFRTAPLRSTKSSESSRASAFLVQVEGYLRSISPEAFEDVKVWH